MGAAIVHTKAATACTAPATSHAEDSTDNIEAATLNPLSSLLRPPMKKWLSHFKRCDRPMPIRELSLDRSVSH